MPFYVKAYRHNWDTAYYRIYNTLNDDSEVTGELNVRDQGTYWGYEDHGGNAQLKLNFNNGLEYIVSLDHQNFSGTDDVWRIGDQEEQVNLRRK